MIVIMGATGRVGGAVLDILSRTRSDIRAISRRPRETNTDIKKNVEWVVADALDADALTDAFRGASAAFVLNSAPVDAADVYADAGRLSESVARAITRARVPDVVALSSQGAQLTHGTGIVGTLHTFEEALKTTPARLTILRPAYFMESWTPLAQAAQETGHLPAFLSPTSRVIDTVSARDVGAVAARYLQTPVPGVVNIVGPIRYSDDDAARILSELTGRPVAVAPVPAQAVAAAHESVGIGASAAAAIAGMYAAINSTGIPFSDARDNVRGHVTLHDVLERAVAPIPA